MSKNSDKLQPPSSTRVTTDKQGTSWNLPYSLGPERLEPDKGGSSVPTFDVCFHPRVIEFAVARTDYKDMVVNTCLDAVETVMRGSRRKPQAQLARKSHVLKGVLYKSGDPVTMCLSTERKAPEPTKSQKTNDVQSKATKVAKQTKTVSEDKITVLGDKENAPPVQTVDLTGGKEQDSVLGQLKHVEQTDKDMPLIKEVSSTSLSSKTKASSTKTKLKKKMECQLIYRGQFELLHHMQADPGNIVPEDRNRPKELVVEVSFPLASSAKGLDLDVSERMLRLSAGKSVPGDYEPLELALPFPVIEDKGSAKFDRKNHKLVVTLPVQPPPKPKPQSVSLIVQDDEDEDEEEEEEKDQHEQPKTLQEKSSIVVPAPLPQKPKNEGEDEFRMLRETALMVANDPQVLVYAHHKAQNSKSTTPTSPVQVMEPAAIQDSLYDDLPPLESCSDDEESATEASTEQTASPANKIKPSESTPEITKDCTATEPPFKIQDTPTCLSYMVNVADIDSASVKLSFPSASSLHLHFSSNDKHYDLDIATLPVKIDPVTAEFDVASENMVVILQKENSVSPQAEFQQKVTQLDTPAPPAPLAAARFQNQLLYELD
ncbi:hypothetical protein BBO99_00002681 [Phytophthora kernoviae]|uniref:PIH1 domain-containing protein 1 n=1 Tax=Phytophthora kernoviae TaxID=325452 RepID=A0A421FB52_9STRA|nr:hypothetical protein JM18_002813 [Phytophthora kernoviae]RLN36658.1 hypothetical protein BBI17_002680 [Phytophthora kernoviae]RLN82718.1 hypothetical protein BBO99_00002681 [Phytophthora kernoviae]